MSNSWHNVWAGGSFRQQYGRSGAGYLIIDPRGIKTEKFLTLPGLKREFLPHGSDIAEMSAAAYALEFIYSNATRARVRLHLDCENVAEWLQEKRITSKKKQGIPPLQAQFDRAVSFMKTMAEMEIVKVGRKNPNLQIVDRLAQTASRP